MKYLEKHLIWCILITISLISSIPLWVMPGGITPAFSQELRRHAHETGAKEGGMTEVKKLTEEEGKYLLGVARRTIEKELFNRKGPKLPEADLPGTFREYRGTFVTLTKGGSEGLYRPYSTPGDIDRGYPRQCHQCRISRPPVSTTW